MFNQKQIWSIGLVTVLAAGIPVIGAHRAGAVEPERQNFQLSWDTVWRSLATNKRKKDPPLISRGQICLIAPLAISKQARVWNTRPLFIWRGPAERIEVSDESGTLVWKQVIRNGGRVLYSGKPLQPGRTYIWKLFQNRADESPKTVARLRVMNRQERDRVTADLMAIETQFKTQNAQPEELALQRANYFISHDLLADALQELYSVKAPSNALQEIVQKAPSELCNSES